MQYYYGGSSTSIAHIIVVAPSNGPLARLQQSDGSPDFLRLTRPPFSIPWEFRRKIASLAHGFR